MLDLGNVHFYRDDSANWVRKLKSFFGLCFLLVEPKDTKGGPPTKLRSDIIINLDFDLLQVVTLSVFGDLFPLVVSEKRRYFSNVLQIRPFYFRQTDSDAGRMKSR